MISIVDSPTSASQVGYFTTGKHERALVLQLLGKQDLEDVFLRVDAFRT